MMQETRPRWNLYATGTAGVVISTIIALIFWAILADPRGPIRMYTPLWFFAITAWLVVPIIWMYLVFENYPFSRLSPKKRVVMIPVSVIIAIVCIAYFFYFYGPYSVPYFSWPKLESMGIAKLAARDYSCYALAYSAIVVIFGMGVWPILFQNWPWKGKVDQPSLGLAVFAIGLCISVFLFQILVHPHFGEAFPKTQKFVAATPWWKDIALTYHGNFVFGWFVWAVVYLIMTATIWEGRPWTAAKKQPWIGIFGLVGIILISLLTMYVVLSLMDINLGYAIPGGRRSAGLYWRYLHSAEVAGFMLYPTLALYYYFGNIPKRFSPEVNWAIRTAVVFIAGFIIHQVYYAVGPALLGVPTSWDSEAQLALVWATWWIVPLLYHCWFMDRWPLYVEQ